MVLTLSTTCFALEEKPWFGDSFELYFDATYDYNFFRKVDRATPQLSNTFNTHVLKGGLDVTAIETWNWEAELEFADTTPISWGYRSFALQIRKLWLDDICGDCVSLTTGLSYRDASSRMRKALSTPYHSRANFELNTSAGKEWSSGCYWFFRTYGNFAIGQGTSGSPWLRGDLYFLWNWQNQHQVRLYLESYWGLGKRITVPTNPFSGWDNIRHQSIDLGASYRLLFSCYGSLQFDYMYRIYARSYPEHVNLFLFTYHLPFSIF